MLCEATIVLHLLDSIRYLLSCRRVLYVCVFLSNLNMLCSGVSNSSLTYANIIFATFNLYISSNFKIESCLNIGSLCALYFATLMQRMAFFVGLSTLICIYHHLQPPFCSHKSVRVMGPRIWNRIKKELKCCKTIGNFKRLYKINILNSF